MLQVKLLSRNATLPIRATSGSAGYDLYSAGNIVIPARGMGIIPLDIALALPPFTYGRIASRSGLSSKSRLEVGAGVIDGDYRGAISVVMYNHGDNKYLIESGRRIAQLIVQVIETPPVLRVVEFDKTTRGEGGFGSTGFQPLESHIEPGDFQVCTCDVLDCSHWRAEQETVKDHDWANPPIFK